MEGLMEDAIISRCGYRCDLCLAFKPNVEKKDERVLLSNGWFEIFGFRIEPEKILCEGCVSCENPELIDVHCPVRPCVIRKDIPNCAYCEEFICDKLIQRIVHREGIEKSIKRKVTEEEYILFIKPYESKERLDKIRESLR
jgi:hypothetical protein